MLNNQELAKYIDHTLLRPGVEETEVVETCREAREFGFKTVCVSLDSLPVAVRELKGSEVLPIAVIGFPVGNEATPEKIRQTQRACELGAREIDMVINRTLLSAKKYAEVVQDIRAVVESAQGVPVKVILETCELSDEMKVIACALSVAAGASFVKTSTGFSTGGATAEDVALMRRVVGPQVGVKASGGIRDRETADKMIAAGASRLGCSASVAIVKGETSTSSY